MLTQKMDENPFSSHSAIDRAKYEFARHIATGGMGEFQLSAKAGADLSKLMRSIDERRHFGGELTDAEHRIMKEAEEVLEQIAQFNSRQSKAATPPQGTYNLQTSRTVPENVAPESPVVIPRISQEEADRIVDIINKQFEEKVMKPIREAKEKGQPVVAIPEEEPVPESHDTGSIRPPSLQEYLETVKGPSATVPFADEDSHFDLSKLVKHDVTDNHV